MVKKPGCWTMDVMPRYNPYWEAMDDDYCHNFDVDQSGTKTDVEGAERDNDAGSDRAAVADYDHARDSLRDELFVVVVRCCHLDDFHGSAVVVETGCGRDVLVVGAVVFVTEVVVVAPELHTLLLQTARVGMDVAGDAVDAAGNAVVG